MNKLILIVLDGLNDKVAIMNMGYMEHLVEMGIAKKSTVTACLPTLSRPLYETILTGKAPYEHGITNNDIVRLSKGISLFHKVEAAGYKSAAAAYSWISELYMKAPFNPMTGGYQLDGKGPIHYGIYYYEDMYPDSHLFRDAKFLLDKYKPEFLYIHPMNVDYWGHQYGSHSVKYSLITRRIDNILSSYLPRWIDENYTIIVTADHGMGEDCSHGGIHDDERLVPFWYIKKSEDLDAIYLPQVQTEIFKFVLERMDI